MVTRENCLGNKTFVTMCPQGRLLDGVCEVFGGNLALSLEVCVCMPTEYFNKMLNFVQGFVRHIHGMFKSKRAGP